MEWVNIRNKRKAFGHCGGEFCYRTRSKTPFPAPLKTRDWLARNESENWGVTTRNIYMLSGGSSPPGHRGHRHNIGGAQVVPTKLVGSRDGALNSSKTRA